MKSLCRLCALWLLVFWLPGAMAQPAPTLAIPKVAKIEIKHVGPTSVSDELIRSNIRIKPGDNYLPGAVDEDVRNLYATGLFYNIRVAADSKPEGIVLTYLVQGNPRLTEIKFRGNKELSDSKLRKKLTSKVGEPLNERKLFTDSQEIQKAYQKGGFPSTEVKYTLNIDENAGRGSATFEIKESPKIQIVEVVFDGAKAFPEKKLRKVIKTRKHWMFSWLTGSGYLKDEEFEDDKEKLAEFYRDHGYIDFEIKNIQFEHPTPETMVIRFTIYEGTQYKVGSVKFSGNKVYSTNELAAGMRRLHAVTGTKGKLGPNGLSMDVGDVFTPKGLTKDIEQVEDFYGSKGHIDVAGSARNLNVLRIPNTDTGTMDLEFQVDEGQKSYIEKIEIRGNAKTKDRVIRRELAVSPGEVFDMVRVKVSKRRLEGLQYFEKVDTRSEATDISPSRKNLIVGVDEKSTGNLTVGAGFSSVDSIVGFAEVYQGNFDLFHPPTFTGGGQKFRLRVQLGTERQDYLLSFIEPWFLGQRLSLGVDLYHRDLAYQSVGGLYDELRTGGRVSLTKALWHENLIGSVSYTLEDVGIIFNTSAIASGYVQGANTPILGTGAYPPTVFRIGNTPDTLLKEAGHSLLSKSTFTLAYDTRNSIQLPNHGQRTELLTTLAGGPLGGDKNFYKLEVRTGWYFKGLAPGHVLEVVGNLGVADAFGRTDDVPFYERFYLGGLDSLRGFRYRGVSPREPGIDEPIGGDTSWFGSMEYSVPIVERMRFAVFYDVGSVELQPYHFSTENLNDNWGFGLRLNLPIGPLRLDYGIPIHHDQFNSGSGRFQFGVGYVRQF